MHFNDESATEMLTMDFNNVTWISPKQLYSDTKIFAFRRQLLIYLFGLSQVFKGSSVTVTPMKSIYRGNYFVAGLFV